MNRPAHMQGVKERPVIFGAESIRAILEGRKTQTRRIAKPVSHPDLGNSYTPGALVLESEPQHVIERACPYGQPGDRLWVRETWMVGYESGEPGQFSALRPSGLTERDGRVFYRATFDEPDPKLHGRLPWRSPIHMPRWASRLLLEVESVRVERLQDISEEDALAEGGWTYGACPVHKAPVKSFALAWDRINGKRAPWKDNPFVWAVTFRRLESP